MTVSILEQCWGKLDEVVDEILVTREGFYTDKDLALLTGKARGMAEFLAIFMVPHFTTPEEISKEAGRRRKARLAGEEVVTKGLGSRAYEFENPKYDKAMPVKSTPTRRTVSQPLPTMPVKPISDDEKQAIRDAGLMMTVHDLSIIYSCSEGQIREILGPTE